MAKHLKIGFALLYMLFIAVVVGKAEQSIIPFLTSDSMQQEKTFCVSHEGTWIVEHRECEYIPKGTCEEAGGVFQECASACRHEEAEEGVPMACTMQCVQVCEFTKEEVNEEENILENCETYFDGCNDCMVGENDMLACTRKFCSDEMMREPKCLKFTDIHTTELIEESTDNITLKVEYPITKNRKFNRMIKDFVMTRVNDFKETIGEEQISENWKNGFYISFESFSYSQDIRSYKFTVTEYTGGAHDNMYFETFTFDFAKKKAIAFRDLFQEEHNPLWTLVPLTQEQLAKTVGDNRMMQMGTEENFENYKYFAVTANELVLFFPPYQVAPWAAGPQTVKFTWEDINVILQPPFFLGNE
jgi:peptidoglycan-N-acetylglucosamine deacetylase